MPDNALIRKVAHALAMKHYKDRFPGRDDQIIVMNADANWNVFAEEGRLAIMTAGEEFAKMADQEARDRLQQAERWEKAEALGEGDRASHQRFSQNNRLEAECAGRIATAIRIRLQAGDDHG